MGDVFLKKRCLSQGPEQNMQTKAMELVSMRAEESLTSFCTKKE